MQISILTTILMYILVFRLSSTKRIHTKSQLLHNLWSTRHDYSRQAAEKADRTLITSGCVQNPMLL